MAYKTFTGESIKEAVDAARFEFGNDFEMINSEKRVHRTGLFGLFGKKEYFQVTIRYDENLPPRRNASLRDNQQKLELLDQIKKIQEERIRGNSPTPEIREVLLPEERAVGAEIAELKEMLSSFINTGVSGKQQSGARQGFERVREFLLLNDFGHDFIDETVEFLESNLTFKQSSDEELVESKLKDWLGSAVKVGPPVHDESEGPRVIALVGPTGVGKTTTLAKIGAEYALIQKKRVSFISMDDYRIGAQEQLEKYADIIRAPVHLLHRREQLEQAITDGTSDYYLLDTAGRSQKNEMQIAEIRSILRDLPLPVDIYLVVSATTKYSDLVEIMKNFSALRYERLIATKADETNTFGSLISGLAFCQKELVWLCMGQGVPDDIKLAETRDLIDRVMVQYRVVGDLAHA